MQGRFVPDGIAWAGGVVHALLNDPFLTHFVHRWWAWGVVVILIVLARKIRANHRPASIAIHCAFGVQVLLGIATVWSGMSLSLAVLHQLIGALLLACCMNTLVAYGAFAEALAHWEASRVSAILATTPLLCLAAGAGVHALWPSVLAPARVPITMCSG